MTVALTTRVPSISRTIRWSGLTTPRSNSRSDVTSVILSPTITMTVTSRVSPAMAIARISRRNGSLRQASGKPGSHRISMPSCDVVSTSFDLFAFECGPNRSSINHRQSKDRHSAGRVDTTRPAECRSFDCLWLIDDRFGPHSKANKSKLVLTTSQDGIEIRCDPGFPDAWRKEPFRRDIRAMAMAGETRDVTVIVIVGERMTLVTSEREFDLGVVRPDQRIVREIDGTRVVNATVMKATG